MPCSASIEQSSVCATTTPESCTDFFGGMRKQTLPAARVHAVAHRVVLIPGDGTGPELTEATRRVLEATGVEFDWVVEHAGVDVMDDYDGNPLPQRVLDTIREVGTALKGPITTPVGGG